MKIYCKELNAHFEDKEELFKALNSNIELIKAKKRLEQKSCDKGLSVLVNQKTLIKYINNEVEKAFKIDDEHYYLVINSANYLDSHLDVHLNGNWDKTVQEKQNKIFLVWHHELDNVENILAFPKDVELMTANVSWKSLGKDYSGSTYSLIFKILKSNIQNEKVKKWLDEDVLLQASVRMEYIKFLECYKTSNKEFEEQYKNYQKYIDIIVNKDEFTEEIIYFWAIKEAKIIMEGSLLPFGSNSATGNISNKNTQEPSKDTLENEPSKDTQKHEEQLKKLLTKF